MTAIMESTNNMDLGLLKRIMRMDKEQLFNFLEKELSRVYKEIDTNGLERNFMFCEGQLPILVIAHLDTVFEDYNYGTSYMKDDWWSIYDYHANDVSMKEIYHDRVEGVMWSPEGLGADDRVGVFMIVSLVRRGLRPYILFTTDEESGSASGYEFAALYQNEFKNYNIKYLMELDRSGYNDCVFYNCDNPLFVEFVESYGFEENSGSFTDISAICPILGIAGVNLSVGYYNEHSKTEMIDLFTMSKNFDIIYKMIKESKKINKYFKYIPKKFTKKKKPKQKKIERLPDEENFEVVIGNYEDEVECCISGSPLVDYLYAEDFGKICLDCYTKLYN